MDLADLRHYHDFVLPFQIGSHTRGRVLRLEHSLTEIISQHAYPEPVARLLVELVTLGASMAASLKYEGIFTLQIKGDGPVRLAVADITSEGHLRGYAQFDQARFADPWPTDVSLPHLVGQGFLAFTVDQGEHTDRYQGIVELNGSNLVDCVHHYFRQSEQLQASFKIAMINEAGNWRSGGLMVQALPRDTSPKFPLWEDEDTWRRTIALMASATSSELVSEKLALEELLYRLFHEDGVRVFSGQKVEARCRCSEQRVRTILKSLDPSEIIDLEVDNRITVTCEFCNRQYYFAKEEFLDNGKKAGS